MISFEFQFEKNKYKTHPFARLSLSKPVAGSIGGYWLAVLLLANKHGQWPTLLNMENTKHKNKLLVKIVIFSLIKIWWPNRYLITIHFNIKKETCITLYVYTSKTKK